MMAHENKEHEEELMECAEAVRILGHPIVSASLHVAGDKIVHFVRHGEAEHNAFARVWRDEQREGSPYVASSGCPIDPPLTELGRSQAQAAGVSLSKKLSQRDIPMFCSPLRRAAQTALLAESKLEDAAFSTRVAMLDLRERFGLHVCDSLGGSAKEFPSIDWSLIPSAADDVALKMDSREPYVQLVERARRVVQHIAQIPQKEVAIFSHSAFMLALVNGAIVSDDDQIKKWFSVGEVRTLHLKWN